MRPVHCPYNSTNHITQDTWLTEASLIALIKIATAVTAAILIAFIKGGSLLRINI